MSSNTGAERKVENPEVAEGAETIVKQIACEVIHKHTISSTPL